MQDRTQKSVTSSPVDRGLSQGRRMQVNASIRAPGAETFNALRVPNIGATRRTGVGDNARALAQALGHFSSSLGSVLGPMAMDEKKRAEEAEKRRLENRETQRVWMDGANSSDPDTRSANQVARHETHAETGYDPNIRAVQSDIEFDKYRAEFDTGLKAEREALSTSGFRKVDEDGNPTEEIYTRPEIRSMAEAKRRAIFEMYPGTSDAQIRHREYLLQRSHSWELATLDAQNRAVVKQREDKYKEAAPLYLGQTYNSAVQSGQTDPKKIWDGLNEVETGLYTDVFNLPTEKDPSRTAIVSDMTRVDRGITILKTLRDSEITSDEDAKTRLAMMDTVSVGGKLTLAEDPRFKAIAQKIRRKAQERLALSERTAAISEAQAVALDKIKKGQTRSQLDLKPIDTYYGDEASGGRTKLPNSPTVRQQEQGIVEALKADVLKQDPELADNPQQLALATVDKLKGSGFTDPELVNQFSDYQLPDPQAEPDPTFTEKFGLYMAIKTGDPQNLGAYIKNKEVLEAFKFVEDSVTAENIEDRALTPDEALQIWQEHKANGGEAASSRADYRKPFRAFETEWASKLTKEQRESIKERADVLLSRSTKSPKEVTDFLKKMAEEEAKSNVTFNGHATRIPDGANPSEWQAKLEHFKNASKLQAELGGYEQTWVGWLGSFWRTNPHTRLVRVEAHGKVGYRVFNENGTPATDSNNNLIFIPDSRIEELWAQRAREEEAKVVESEKEAVQGVLDKRATAKRSSERRQPRTAPYLEGPAKPATSQSDKRRRAARRGNR